MDLIVQIPDDLDDVLVCHAGTTRDDTGRIVTSGGRVLSVTGFGESFEVARRRSLNAAGRIQFEGKQFRTDIGWREVTRGAGAS